MEEEKQSKTTISTLDASTISYDVEKVLIEKPGITDEEQIKTLVESTVNIPSNLEYLRSDYDEATGTSGVAFRDTDTGEIILAYTGTNPNGDFNTDVVMADGAGIAAGTGVHYQSAFDFYEEIRDEYGEPTLTRHSLGGNVAQRGV